MLTDVGITCDISGGREAVIQILDLAPKMHAAVRRAINRTATGVRTDMVKTVREDFYISATNIRDAIQIERANYKQLQARLHGSGKPGIPLFDFKRSPTRVPSTIRTKGGGYSPVLGVSVGVSKSIGVKGILGAFTARMTSGHEGVWVRTGVKTSNGRAQIRELFGPSVERLFAGRRYKNMLNRSMSERLNKALAYEMRYVLEVKRDSGADDSAE